MNMENENRIILRTYKSVWKIPRKIYSIDNIKLFVPVDVDQAMYFIASLGITFILLNILPFLGNLPFVFKYIALPYGLMKFFTKQKLDGKLPHKFFADLVVFLLSPGQFVRFKAAGELKLKNVRFSSRIICRYTHYVNKTEEALNNRMKKLKKKGGKNGV